jgi:hypothetical protein
MNQPVDTRQPGLFSDGPRQNYAFFWLGPSGIGLKDTALSPV